MNLGGFILEKRKEQHLSREKVAQKAGISPAYYRQIELGERQLYDYCRIEKIGYALGLKLIDIEKMMDLAGIGKGTIAPDLQEYVKNNPSVNRMLRKLKKSNVSDKVISTFSDSK